MNLPSLKEKILKWVSHPFTKDVAVLQTSSILARAVAVLASLIFARILGPEQYGFYGLVFALGGTINIFQDFGIGQAAINLLARARSQNDFAETNQVLNFFGLVSIIGLFTTGLAGFLLAPYLGDKFYHDRYLGELAAIVVAITALTFFYPLAAIVLQVWRKMKSLAILESSNKILMALVPLGLVLLGLKVFGIVIGQLVATIIISIVGIIVYQQLVKVEPLVPKMGEFFRQRLSWKKFKQFFRFSMEIAVGKNLIKFVGTVPLLFTGYFMATDSGIGFYKIALAYVSLPLLLLDPVTRLLDVQFSFTQTAGPQKLFRRFWQVSLVSLAVMLAIILLMVLLASPVIELIFPQYKPSIRLIYGLALYPAIIAADVGIAPLFRTLNKMRVLVAIQFINLTCLIPTSYYLIRFHHIKGLIATTLIFAFLPNFLSYLYLFFFAQKNDRRESI
jgi:stage V sporulation protein B